MKIRNGFVSNSSSSSFMIRLDDISAKQLLLIKNHIEYGPKFGIQYSNDSDGWTINENEEFITGKTWMDNFDMHYFLNAIGISDEHIVWEPDVDWGDL